MTETKTPVDGAVYKTLLESTKAIPWKIEWSSMKFAYVGPQIEQLVGWAPESWASAQDWAERMHPDERQWVVDYCVSQSKAGTKYGISVSASATASYAYLAPEARIGYRIVGRFEISIGVELLAFVALDQPAWKDASPVLAGAPGDGLSTFGRQTTAGSFLLTALPSIGVHQAF